MKRINLITPKRYFPVPLSLQKRIFTTLFLLLLAITSYRYYRLYTELKDTTTIVANLEADVTRLKQTLSEKRAIDEKAQYIEKEFADISADYNILKKNVIIKDIMAKLSDIVPESLWLTSIDFINEPEKKINVSGKSRDKDAIFSFLNNLSLIGKSVELTGMNREGENGSYSFQITLELL